MGVILKPALRSITPPQEAFDSKLLSHDYHDRLLADLNRIVRVAGVPHSAVWSKLSDFCEEDKDYLWVKNLRRNEDAGLVYIGKTSIPVEEKMRAITGACLRNYMDARIMSVQDVVKRLKEDTMPTPSLLLLPNFCLDKTDGGDVASWDVAQLLGLLLDRASLGKKTVLYIPSWAVLEKQYGTVFREHFELYFATMMGKTYSPAKISQYVEA